MRETINVVAAALPDSGKFGGGGPNHQISIAIYIAAEKPDGVPEANWLPINREDIEIGSIMRLYEPDLERLDAWTAPRAEKVGQH